MNLPFSDILQITLSSAHLTSFQKVYKKEKKMRVFKQNWATPNKEFGREESLQSNNLRRLFCLTL